jgi:hypothetical protein
VRCDHSLLHQAKAIVGRRINTSVRDLAIFMSER